MTETSRFHRTSHYFFPLFLFLVLCSFAFVFLSSFLSFSLFLLLLPPCKCSVFTLVKGTIKLMARWLLNCDATKRKKRKRDERRGKVAFIELILNHSTLFSMTEDSSLTEFLLMDVTKRDLCISEFQFSMSISLRGDGTVGPKEREREL